jgi:hypothetical protein
MAVPDFWFEQTRQSEARHLQEPCQDDVLRLTRTLFYGPQFQWLLVEAPDENLRCEVMAALDKVLYPAGLGTNRLPLSHKIKDVPMLEEQLVNNARRDPVVHLIDRTGWLHARRWEVSNIRRERLATKTRAQLVFWLDAKAIALASSHAPDIWAWRGGIYSFLPAAAPASLPGVEPDTAHQGRSELRNERTTA